MKKNNFNILSLILETAAVFTPAVAFMLFYGKFSEIGVDTWKAHFGLLLSLWAIALLLRATAFRLFPSHAWIISIAICSLISSLIFSYYLAAAIGLASWGKIITWKILNPYIFNAIEFIDYAEIPRTLAAILALTAAGVLILFWWLTTGKHDPVRIFSKKTSPLAFYSILTAGTAIVSIYFFMFFENPNNYRKEPVSLTFIENTETSNPLKHLADSPEAAKQEAASREVLASLSAPSNRPNIIIIVSDGLRADRMTPYGYRRDTTPRIAQRINEAKATKEPLRAISVCAETFCGMPGLLYSKPAELMNKKALGFSEALQAIGYKSYIILAGDHTNYYGLADLYKPADIFFDSSTQKNRFVNDDIMLIDAVTALPSHSEDQPVFIQLHLQSNHPLGLRWKESNWYQPSGNYARWSMSTRHEANLSREQKEMAENYYDNGVKQMDVLVDKILDILKIKGYLKKTIILITGDHGEMLGEHNILSHTYGLYQPVLEIPAIFLNYGHQMEQIPSRRWVSQVDLIPTLWHEVTASRIPSWTGVPLHENETREFFTFQQKAASGLLVVSGEYKGYKYWIDSEQKTEQVFNLAVDPEEKNNLLSSIPADQLNHWRNVSLRNLAATQGLIH